MFPSHDLKARVEVGKGREIHYPNRELWIEPTLDDLEHFSKYIYEADLLSVDIETGWGQITCIGFSTSQERAICVPFVDLRATNKSYWKTAEEELEAIRYMREWLECSVPKLGQNFAAYDVYWLLDKWGIRPVNLLEDTRLLHATLYPELPKSLQFMGASYTEQGIWKTWGKKGDKRDDS